MQQYIKDRKTLGVVNGLGLGLGPFPDVVKVSELIVLRVEALVTYLSGPRSFHPDRSPAWEYPNVVKVSERGSRRVGALNKYLFLSLFPFGSVLGQQLLTASKRLPKEV